VSPLFRRSAPSGATAAPAAPAESPGAGSGQAGSGQAGSGQAGSGQAGSGQAGDGQGAARKGRPTPRRKDSQTRRRVVEPPPPDRKEAYKRLRERQKEERAASRAGMQRGDERYLLARDRGPERKLVRDLVDARRNVGTWFFAGAFIVIVGSSSGLPAQVRLAANVLWLGLIAVLILDSVLIARMIKREVTARHPGTTERMGALYFYGITRSTMFRRLRSPRPTVGPGDAV